MMRLTYSVDEPIDRNESHVGIINFLENNRIIILKVFFFHFQILMEMGTEMCFSQFSFIAVYEIHCCRPGVYFPDLWTHYRFLNNLLRRSKMKIVSKPT